MTKSASSYAAVAPKTTTISRSKLQRLKRHDIAIDLGTSSTRFAVEGKGLLIDQPSVVCTNTKTGQIVAMGESAREMIGRSPQTLMPTKPVVEGVVKEYELVEYIASSLLAKVHKENRVLFQRPNVIMNVPCSITEVEQRSLIEAVKSYGTQSVYLIDEPVAAALGAGIDVFSEKGILLIDIGGGTTDIALIASGRTLVTRTVRVAGQAITEAIRQCAKDEFNVLLGESTCEEVKIAVAKVGPSKRSSKISVRGRSTVSGLPQEIELSGDKILSYVLRQVRPILDAIKSVVDEVPAEAFSDIAKNGIFLSGGGSLLEGLDRLIRSEVHIDVHRVQNPLTAVAEGGLVALSDPVLFKRLVRRA